NVNDIIYINQGDIVNYFENGSLKDLIQESGEIENYKKALDFFKVKKQDLVSLVERLIELYTQFYELINSNFTLHNKDISSILDSSYIFKAILNIENKNDSFQESDNVLSSLFENIKKFRTNENWLLNEKELEIVQAFENLLKLKKELFNGIVVNHNKKEIFNKSIEEIISNKNSNLDLKGREKEASNQRLILLNKNISEAFAVAKEFEKHCLIFENLKYGGFQEIKINEEVTVILEVENNESIKDKILEGLSLNPVKTENISLFQLLIKLSLDQIKIKNLSNSPENLLKKINTQIKTILESFDRPIEYL